MHSLFFFILFVGSALSKPLLSAEKNTDPILLSSEESAQFRNARSTLLLAQKDAVFRNQNPAPIRLRRFIRTETGRPEKLIANLVQDESQVARGKGLAKGKGKPEERKSRKDKKIKAEEKLKSNPIGRSALADDKQSEPTGATESSTSLSPDIETDNSSLFDNEPQTSLSPDIKADTSLSDAEQGSSDQPISSVKPNAGPNNEPDNSLKLEAEPGTSLPENEPGTTRTTSLAPVNELNTGLAGEVTDASQATEQPTEPPGTDGSNLAASIQAAPDKNESEPDRTDGEPVGTSQNPVDQSGGTQKDDSTNEPNLTDNLASESENLTNGPGNELGDSTTEQDNLTSEPNNLTSESSNLAGESGDPTGETESNHSPALNGVAQVNATNETATTETALNVTAILVKEPTAHRKPCLRKLNGDDDDYVDDIQNALINDRIKYYNGRNLAKQKQQSKFMIDFLGWLCIAAFGFICGVLIGLMVFSSS